MTFSKLTLSAAAVALATSPAQADAAREAEEILRSFQRIAAQYLLLGARTFVDLTYENLQVEPGTNALVVSGITLYPVLEWDENGDCAVTIDRAEIGSGNEITQFNSLTEVNGLTVPTACLPPDMAGPLLAFGYADGVTADTMSISFDYDVPSAAADIDIRASVVDTAEVDISAHFDYFWFRFPVDGGDEPEPVAILGNAEIAIENNGIWQKVEPMIGGGPAVSQMVPMFLGGMLTDGGAREPSPQEQAFMENVQAEIDRFVANQDRIVVSMEPDGGLFLHEDIFESPSAAIELLEPTVSAVPTALRSMIPMDQLTAALSGGAGLADDARLSAGLALVTGLGAPLAPAEGQALLMPLANAWNGEAAAALAESFAMAEQLDVAYGMALKAAASGETGALGLVDDLEAEMALANVLGAQTAAAESFPDAAAVTAAGDGMIAAGDISGMRKHAYSLIMGKEMPRNYAAGYYWASLAAAAGDRGAARLRDRLDARLASDPVWRATAQAQGSEALATWTGGLAATVGERLQ